MMRRFISMRTTTIFCTAVGMLERRTFTLSCSRCRISKLKCDRKEPCGECKKRNVGHLCKKDQRIKRRKRISAVEGNVEQAKEDGTQKTVEDVEEFVFQKKQNEILSDLENPYWQAVLHSTKRQKEQFDVILEIAQALPDPNIIRCLSHVFSTRCQAALGNVFHTPFHMVQIEKLCHCLLASQLTQKVEALTQTFSMDVLANLLLSLCLGLDFHPSPALTCWTGTASDLQVENIRQNHPTLRIQWRNLAIRCLHSGLVPFSGSIVSLQANVMLLLDGHEDMLTLDGVLANAISGARRMGLHQLGNARLKPTRQEEAKEDLTMLPHIRLEIGIRIWWALSIYDWSGAQATGQYNIHPFQVSTRKPFHINEEDLSDISIMVDDQGYISERPKTEFTELSYTICLIDIASIVREMVDVHIVSERNYPSAAQRRLHCSRMYEDLVANLPVHFRLGSLAGVSVPSGPIQAIPVHRWMIHQQLWSILLRLYRNSLSTLSGLESCHQLALNVINSQSQLQSLCVVCRSISTNEMQLFNAAVILLIDLLEDSKKQEIKQSSDQLVRLMTREKVQEAIELLRTSLEVNRAMVFYSFKQERESNESKGNLLRGIKLLEALMVLETNETVSQLDANLRKSKSKSIREKVMDVIKTISIQQHQQQPSAVFAEEVLSDLNVLPITADGFGIEGMNFFEYNNPSMILTTNASTTPKTISNESESLADFLKMMASTLFSQSPD